MTSILVVEDHVLFVQSLVRLLRERGKYDVMAVSSAEQALEQLPKAKFDIALIDVSLPGRSGIDLIPFIHEKAPELPCMIVSGHTASNYMQQAIAEGAQGYVLKEDINGILEGVEQVLRGGKYISLALRRGGGDAGEREQ